MSQTIYKYPFSIAGSFHRFMPLGAKILTVQMQHGIPCIWALVDPSLSVEIRKFRVFGTGHQLPADWNGQYVGTFQMMDGELVWHLYSDPVVWPN